MDIYIMSYLVSIKSLKVSTKVKLSKLSFTIEVLLMCSLYALVSNRYCYFLSFPRKTRE